MEDAGSSGSSSDERDASRSRSGSPEPGTGPDVSDGSEGSDGSDEEEHSSTPVKTPSKRQRSSSGSASPGQQKKQLSKSHSPAAHRKLSRSTSSPRRSTSKTVSRRKQSRFVESVYLNQCYHECVRKCRILMGIGKCKILITDVSKLIIMVKIKIIKLLKLLNIWVCPNNDIKNVS